MRNHLSGITQNGTGFSLGHLHMGGGDKRRGTKG